jgi:hypothetical protein
MAEQFLHALRVRALREEQCRAGVAQVVRADRGKTSTRQDRFQVLFIDRVARYRRADDGRKDQVVILVCAASFQPFFGL